MKKWITESELCIRWDMNAHNIRELALNGNLQPFHDDHTQFIIYDGGTAIELPDGRFETSPAPATANDVADCIYLVSEVEEYEKENGITPRVMPTDLPKRGITENPLVDPAQEKSSDKKPIPKPRKAIIYAEAVMLRRDYPNMDKVEAKEKIDAILKSNKYSPKCRPYSRTQFNRIIKDLHFQPGKRGPKTGQ